MLWRNIHHLSWRQSFASGKVIWKDTFLVSSNFIFQCVCQACGICFLSSVCRNCHCALVSISYDSAVTKYHKFILSKFWRPGVENNFTRLKSRCWKGWYLLEALKDKSVSLPFAPPASICKAHRSSPGFYYHILFPSCSDFSCLWDWNLCFKGLPRVGQATHIQGSYTGYVH